MAKRIVNSIELAVFRDDITAAVAEGALADLASDLTEGRLALASGLFSRHVHINIRK